jgi:hypothetical protein
MDLDPPRLRLLQLVADRDTDLASVSRAIGKNHAYLQQYVKRSTPRNLAEEVRIALGGHFKVDPSEFRPGGTTPAAVTARKMRGLIPIAGQDYALLPVYDLRLSAGAGAYAGEESEPLYFEPYRFQWLRSITAAAPEMLVVARVEGDSMEPTLHNGDQVLLDRTRTRATRDGIYGLRREEDIQVKRVAVDPRSGLLTIISDNPQYPRWDGVSPEQIEIIGRVIWLGRQV